MSVCYVRILTNVIGVQWISLSNPYGLWILVRMQVRSQDAIWVLAGVSGEGRDAAWFWMRVGISPFLSFWCPTQNLSSGCVLDVEPIGSAGVQPSYPISSGVQPVSWTQFSSEHLPSFLSKTWLRWLLVEAIDVLFFNLQPCCLLQINLLWFCSGTEQTWYMRVY